MRTVAKSGKLVIAGGKKEAEELQRQFFAPKFAGWESALPGSSRFVLDKTERNSDARCALQAVLAQSRWLEASAPRFFPLRSRQDREEP